MRKVSSHWVKHVRKNRTVQLRKKKKKGQTNKQTDGKTYKWMDIYSKNLYPLAKQMDIINRNHVPENSNFCWNFSVQILTLRLLSISEEYFADSINQY